MNIYKKSLAGAAICAVLTGLCVPAMSQTQPPNTTQRLSGTGNSEAEGRTLETVVVTAQKRAESIQDVPITITVFTEAQIDALGVSTLEDLPYYMSGVELLDDRGAGQPTWIIRGVGLFDFNSNNSPTASIFDDEVYLGSNVLAGLGLFDLERVEVLKGAQGGLYGRNTTGGATSRSPRRHDSSRSAGAKNAPSTSSPSPISGSTPSGATTWVTRVR